MRKVQFLIVIGVTAVLAACGGGDNTTPETTNNTSFTIKLISASANGFQGSKGLLNVQLERKNNFTGDVELNLKTPPTGVTSSKVLFGTASEVQLPIQVAKDAPVGNMSLTVQGSSGLLNATTSLDLNIQPPKPQSQDLIATALKGGRIDLGTSLEYRAYALFGDARLPDEFVGGGSQSEDNDLFVEVQLNKAQLSVVVLATLEPFLVRPNDPKSIFNVQPVTKAKSILSSRTVGECPNTTDLSWISVLNSTYPIRVWGACAGSVADRLAVKDNISKTLAIFDKIYEPMTTLMGQPIPDLVEDNAIDIYLTPVGYGAPRPGNSQGYVNQNTLTFAGLTFPAAPFIDTTSSAYILLPTSQLVMPDFASVVIHEFFHVLKNRYYFSLADFWFTEASADWARVHFNRTIPVDANDNESFHQGHFSDFQSESLSLLSTENTHEYNSYIYPFYIEMIAGSSAIVKIYEKIKGSQTVRDANTAIDSVFSFKDYFRDFAYRNLNKEFLPGDPLPKSKRYVSVDSYFPDNQNPPIFSDHVLEFNEKSKLKMDLEVEPLNSQYYQIKISDQKIKQVIITLSEAKINGIDIDAVIKENNIFENRPRDLNGKDELKFCLSHVDEKLNGSILILSNHIKEIGEKKRVKIDIETLEIPCPSTIIAIVEESDKNESSSFYRKSEWRMELQEDSLNPKLAKFKIVDGGIVQQEILFSRSDMVCKTKDSIINNFFYTKTQTQIAFVISNLPAIGILKPPYYNFMPIGTYEVQRNWSHPSCGISGLYKQIFFSTFGSNELRPNKTVVNLYPGIYPTTSYLGIITTENIPGEAEGVQHYKSTLVFDKSSIIGGGTTISDFIIYP
jgi:hypothetical protein